MRTFSRWIAAVALSTVAVTGLAAQESLPTARGAASEGTYLGVFTTRISEPLQVQFQRWVKPGQGLLVQRVVRNSPAEQAGLREFDILVSINDEVVGSTEQLRDLVAGMEAGTEIKLRIIRSAELQELVATLAERRANRVPRAAAGIQQQQADMFSLPGATNRSIQVKSLDGTRFTIEVSYLDQEGKRQQLELEGTVDELRRQAGELPRLVGDDLQRILASLDPARNQTQALKLKLQPMLNGPNQLLRVSITHPGRQGAIQLVEVQHDFGQVARIDVQDVIALPALQAQLQQLPESVRTRIVETLERTSIPQVQLNTLQAQ